MAFSEYAHFYDLYYADKDYKAEANFVLELASRFGVKPNTLLDMGCGTGRHLAEFVKHCPCCHGFDLSPEMLAQARQRLSGTGVILSEGNLTDFESSKQYDLVVSMFAVMGYMVDNEHLIAALRVAFKHMKPEGVFIFDGWFGPAVLSQQPEERRHEYLDGQETVVRHVVPFLDLTSQSVTVHYTITVYRDGQIIKKKTRKIMSCGSCLSRKWRWQWKYLVWN